CARAHSNFDYW
nr:immunoglobulin heavy chain junction region [Macaca mulatta]MOW88978.1 immunoglobulin heavy chain junction region [Macaca mulatta]MOW89609.1 immunoglobulin heavy chain junction region [Macaca mulatta]MOW92257.1 immunoglobulin heavy chain junction region [Macaca mulatta]MOW92591.1 immunoglobulin heavy chain junction region [Macaca mulatta]